MSAAVNHQSAHSPAELRAELTRLFGHRQFQGAQEAVISQVMAGVDTVAVMPTGAGKSLCYQLPAMLLPGVTVVISPLIALMKDQYDSLPADVYERTTFINSSLDIETLRERMGEIFAGRYKLVYCAPERLRQQPFVDGLRRANVSMVVVDEAHCVSMWGHDFRPDYLFLGKVIPSLGSPVVLALTATATPEIRDEISEQLGRRLKPVVASVFRPNLYYEVETLADKEGKMRLLLDICRSEQGSGVVYARSRETCEQLAAMLRRSGVKAAHYHAGLPTEERSRVQEAFMTDRTRVIVATIAFGMGIDKSNVRFIVHFSPPDTLEGYVQESGRAGRDGRPARCVLLITPGDGRNLSRWSRQEQLKVEHLREIYRAIKGRVDSGNAGFVSLEEVEKEASESAESQIGDTTVRVAISLLEKVGLIGRRYDAPTGVWITLSRDASTEADRGVAGLIDATGLRPGQSGRYDTAPLAGEMGLSPDELEGLLLELQDAGFLRHRGEKREAVIERLPSPPDVAGKIDQMLVLHDEAQQRHITQMLDYATRDRCRHRMLAAHLGEQIDDCGTSCDHCAPPVDRAGSLEKDLPELPGNPGQVIVECLLSFPFPVGKPSLVNALLGSAASNVTPERVRHFGTLARAMPTHIERAIDTLVAEEYLATYETDQGFRLLRVTPEGREGVPIGAVTLAEKKHSASPRAAVEKAERNAIKRGAKTQDAAEAERPATPEEADLFERLRQWRKAAASRAGLPPYVIFHDKTLWAIARRQPTTPDELLGVNGVGQKQLDKYGEEILALLAGE